MKYYDDMEVEGKRVKMDFVSLKNKSQKQKHEKQIELITANRFINTSKMDGKTCVVVCKQNKKYK